MFPEMIQGYKVRVEDNYSNRGTIFDRVGVPLAQDDVVVGFQLPWLKIYF